MRTIHLPTITIAAAVAAATAGAPAPALATVAPDVGRPSSTFVITFPPRGVVADLVLRGPARTRCRRLRAITVPLRRMQSGTVRFGPGVPGARPRYERTGRRLQRWCRGRYHAQIVHSAEFEPGGEAIGADHFTVR